MHEAKRIANEFIQRALEAGHYLTPMQVQKQFTSHTLGCLRYTGRPSSVRNFRRGSMDPSCLKSTTACSGTAVAGSGKPFRWLKRSAFPPGRGI